MARVLVVSGSVGRRTLLNLMLTRSRHHVETVPSRAEAMPLVGKAKPDLVIIDLYLSDEPGLDLASDLRAMHPMLPMLMVSSSVLDDAVPEEEIHAAGQLGINIFQRSLASSDFHTLIHELLNRA